MVYWKTGHHLWTLPLAHAKTLIWFRTKIRIFNFRWFLVKIFCLLLGLDNIFLLESFSLFFYTHLKFLKSKKNSQNYISWIYFECFLLSSIKLYFLRGLCVKYQCYNCLTLKMKLKFLIWKKWIFNDWIMTDCLSYTLNE